MNPPCPHTNRRVIARDEVLEFEECLDCGEIIEKETDATTEAETLSDA